MQWSRSVHDVILPKTGIYEDDVVLIEWIVAEGSWVAVGDPIFVIESEKVEMEIESNDEGIKKQLECSIISCFLSSGITIPW